MDPAGPFFRWMPTHVRLDDSDAALVDVIHTNGGDIALGYLGTEQARPHFPLFTTDSFSKELVTHTTWGMC